MTTTEPTIDSTAHGEPELCWLNLADLAPHPDNPRGSLGDLTELVRSINAHGILEPLVVLPPIAVLLAMALIHVVMNGLR